MNDISTAGDPLVNRYAVWTGKLRAAIIVALIDIKHKDGARAIEVLNEALRECDPAAEVLPS